jgi:hypothetical protein
MAKSQGYVYSPDSGFVFNSKYEQIGFSDKSGYVILNTRFHKMLKAHHYAWYWVYGNVDFEQIDHINGIRTDNRICNLRIVTNQQNTFNRLNTKGYTFDKRRKKYDAQIQFNGKKIHGGYFKTEEEARQRYLELKKLYHIID